MQIQNGLVLTKLKKVQSKQKHALPIIFNQFKTSPSEPLFLNLNVLNFYKINNFQSVQLMHKIETKILIISLLKLFGVPCHVILNKLFSNTTIPKNFTVSNIN